MNNWIKATFGVSGAALFLIFSGNLKGFIEGVEATWLFLGKLVVDAPLGLTSFALALTLASLSISFMNKYIPFFQPLVLRSFIIDGLAALIGLAVMWVQMHDLSGILLGIMAGLSARLVYRFFSTIRELIVSNLPKKQEKVDAGEVPKN